MAACWRSMRTLSLLRFSVAWARFSSRMTRGISHTAAMKAPTRAKTPQKVTLLKTRKGLKKEMA